MDVIEFGKGFLLGRYSEYFIHRFIHHNPWEEEGGYNHHTHHHRHPAEYNHYDLTEITADTWHLLPMNALLVGAWAGLSLFKGPSRSASFIAGVMLGLSAYESQHIRVHNGGPLNETQRKLFKQHMSHHFKNPKTNFGTTTPFFDRLLGTFEDHEVIPVPAHMAPRWLLDNPDSYPEYAVIGLDRMESAKLKREKDREESRKRAGLKPYPPFIPGKKTPSTGRKTA